MYEKIRIKNYRGYSSKRINEISWVGEKETFLVDKAGAELLMWKTSDMKSIKQLMEDPTPPAATLGTEKSPSKRMSSLKDLIDKRNPIDRNKFVTREYQDYGYRLAAELGDLKHKALYIKLAKETERATLERCRTFVMDSKAENKGALFMWKLKQVRKGTP